VEQNIQNVNILLTCADNRNNNKTSTFMDGAPPLAPQTSWEFFGKKNINFSLPLLSYDGSLLSVVSLLPPMPSLRHCRVILDMAIVFIIDSIIAAIITITVAAAAVVAVITVIAPAVAVAFAANAATPVIAVAIATTAVTVAVAAATTIAATATTAAAAAAVSSTASLAYS
jgi:hypothetical protein